MLPGDYHLMVTKMYRNLFSCNQTEVALFVLVRMDVLKRNMIKPGRGILY